MTPAQIAAITAARKRAALANLQDDKHAARARVEELYKERQEQRQNATLRKEERDLGEGHHLDLYPTPPDLAAEMVQIAESRGPALFGMLWLEPSAGTGRIAQAIKQAGHEPNCIELNYNAAKLLQGRGFQTINIDFLEWKHEAGVVVMNPPFSNGQDIEHIRHAYDILSPGGCIIAIMSEGSFYRSDRKARDFQEWFKAVQGQSRRLPSGTFRTSGTMVTARLVEIDK